MIYRVYVLSNQNNKNICFIYNDHWEQKKKKIWCLKAENFSNHKIKQISLCILIPKHSSSSSFFHKFLTYTSCDFFLSISWNTLHRDFIVLLLTPLLLYLFLLIFIKIVSSFISLCILLNVWSKFKHLTYYFTKIL